MSLRSVILKLLEPIETRLTNMIAEATISVVNDAFSLQGVQLRVLEGETLDDGQRFQHYGFTSNPPAGSECVVLFPSGSREQPIVVADNDRESRPTDNTPGHVALYHISGSTIRFTEDGDVVVSAAPGRKVLLDDGSGGTGALMTKADGDGLKAWVSAQFRSAAGAGHVHAVAGLVTTTIITVPTVGLGSPAPSTPPAIVGTTRTEAK